MRPGDRYLVLGVEKERERQGKGAVKEWASMEALRYMAGVVNTKAEWEILALAALSCAHCLRASEAITARAEGSELVFRGSKSRSGEQRHEMGQWTAKWAAFLARLRASHGYHPDVPAWFQGTDGLHRGLHNILDRPGGSFKYLRWHSFRRFGAAQLHGLGLPVRFIMLWGGVEVGDSGTSSWGWRKRESGRARARSRSGPAWKRCGTWRASCIPRQSGKSWRWRHCPVHSASGRAMQAWGHHFQPCCLPVFHKASLIRATSGPIGMLRSNARRYFVAFNHVCQLL